MLRTIRFCDRLTVKSQFSSLYGVRQLVISNFHVTCSTRLKRSSLILKNLSEKNNSWAYLIENHDEDLDSPKKINIRNDTIRRIVSKLIESQGNEIKWDEVIERSIKGCSYSLSRDFVLTIIIQVCREENLCDAFISFFKYLIKKKELTSGLLYLFCRSILGNQKYLEPGEEIVYKIFQKLTPNQAIAQRICCSVLLYSKKYHYIVLKDHKNILTNLEIAELIIHSSFKHNNEETAFEYLKLCKSNNLKNVLPNFLDHFQKQVETGVVPFPRFVELFDTLCINKVNNLTENEINRLELLIQRVNKIDTSHKWSIVKANSLSNRCTVCEKELEKCTVTDEEIEILKRHLKKNVIFQDNIYIRSNHEEWNSFMNFLKKKPYDIVIDGLNTLYAFKKSPSLFLQLINDIELLELTPLILARKHFRKTPEYSVISKKYPVFLTENLSDDDVFILYAAFNKGKNCYAVSRDKMGFARMSFVSVEQEDIFLRWQTSHQCYVSNSGKLILPSGVLSVCMKSPVKRKDEFHYHLMYREGILQNIYCLSRLRRQTKKKIKS